MIFNFNNQNSNLKAEEVDYLDGENNIAGFTVGSQHSGAGYGSPTMTTSNGVTVVTFTKGGNNFLATVDSTDIDLIAFDLNVTTWDSTYGTKYVRVQNDSVTAYPLMRQNATRYVLDVSALSGEITFGIDGDFGATFKMQINSIKGYKNIY